MATGFSHTARLIVAGLLLLALTGTASGQSVQITPIGLTLGERQPVGTLTLANRGNRTTTFHVEAHRWTQSRGEDRLEPSRDLLISPPVFSIEPGQSQTVRVGLRRDVPDNEEAAYRALFREVPPADDAGPEFGLRFALQLSIPVFLAPQTAAHADLRWRATLDTRNRQVVLQALNAGAGHARVTRLELANPGDGTTVAQPWRGLRYVLPGSRQEWRLSLQRNPTPGSTMQILGKDGRDAIDAPVRLE
ncbi:MAG: fimbria/pilus periplasmic chaperone [Aquisalimonadaceae bacterium]